MSTTPSFWLDQLGSRPSRPALAGDRDADVCIIGGGFTGLWTAYELKRADPSLVVVVLEGRQVGFGASGRNGGWVLGKVSGTVDAWRARGGPDAPRAMVRAIQQTVEEIGAVVALEDIECDWKHAGTVTVAQSDTQLARLRAVVDAERRELGEDLAWQLLDADAIAGRIKVDGARGALFTPHCARVQPARLVDGLAAAAERAGVTIYESSPVKALEPGLAVTKGGDVRARYLLRATEGYTADMPGEHRALLPMNSSMIVTEPLPEAEWARIGWAGAETMLDGSHLYTYSQRTADGRIAIGGRGVPYRFGSRTDREGPVPRRTIQELRARLISLFPSLAGVRVTRAWHGILGVSRDWCPTVGLDPVTGLGYAGGYAGEGVAASNLAGRTLRDLVLGRDTDLTRLPWVGNRPRNWEPEPLRFAGARGIYSLYRVADRQERIRDHESRIAGIANKIAGR
ncbi:MAG TPA: FAD-dependent oxidoreductase [Solirubrobacteraceae bacterium]|jgi:glycine/D-amino acid oxidase-like deaminating enzyme|nr:FAD-dependent oxidoreductase [Solirubrobacteraceae bacterium]